MIPQETVQQILQAADLIEVIGDFVSLKKRGANYMACCPFHNEKTPSFSVSPSKQIYKCFGCGRGGDAVRFIMDLEGLSYPEALKWLAQKYGIEIQERELTDTELDAQNERESLFIVSEFAQKYFSEQLHSGEGESIGKSYFKERGFNESTIAKFNLGYSPSGWDTFTKHALKSGFKLEILEKAGLSIVREGREPIDRFRGRVIFPINNVAGKPIAFGARILKPDPKSPKYLNSPETDIYHKSHIVYGIYTAKNAIRQLDNCFLVEGYTDVVSLNQAGIENVVASSGTSLTKEQVQLIRRFSRNITVLYDGDAAGINASLRGTDLILEEDMDVRVVVFPEGEDPDSFIRKSGSEHFKQYIEEEGKDFIRFKTELNLKAVAGDPVKKAALIGDLVGTITKIPDSIKRAVFYQEVARLLQIDEQILINEGNKLLRTAKPQNHKTQAPIVPPIDMPEPNVEGLKQVSVEELAIVHKEDIFVRDLVLHGHEVIEKDEETQEDVTLADYVLHEIGETEFHVPVLGQIFELYKKNYDDGRLLDTSFFTRHENPRIQKKVVDWLSPPYSFSPGWDKYEIYVPSYVSKLDDLSYKNILRLKKEKFEMRYKELSSELAGIENEDDQDILMDQMTKVKKVIQRLADQLGSII
ncbi:DNA primase [Marinilongibacter aquaticus]|uniref:DNA primase n=1 Tax=Marinilongibacter aquaticus TaxID=2975157 RepID=UPI0021BDA4B8|nr:DNA primase [Marinilongibacter aquaticus]UBM60528.1 DNA primase [Marinilongibacter aquaticus]